jgi:glycosyltransferase involved in cell wall biosynthesis
MQVTLVIPTCNEEVNAMYARTLQHSDVELVVVDGGSADRTREMAKNAGARVFDIGASNRAARLNVGIKEATGDVVILHHPRCYLGDEAIRASEQLAQGSWAGFRHRFERSHPGLQFTSFYSNFVRRNYASILYLDHCPVAHNATWKKYFPFPEIDIFEDTEMSKVMRKLGRPKLFSEEVLVSPVRFEKNGFVKQAILNQKLKLQYFAKSHHRKMNQKYEKGMFLNG